MSRKISDAEFRETLDRRLSALQPDPWMARKVRNLARGKEEPMKKRFSLGIVILIAILAISMSVGIATVTGWDVVRFLYGDRTVQKLPEVETFPVHTEVSSGGALLRVESAVYDGKHLAFDLYFENLEPDPPIECKLDELTANGIPVSAEKIVETIDNVWVPNLYDPNPFLQGGESAILPEELQGKEILHICLKVRVYRPIDPVYQSRELTPEEAAAKTEEGYLVIVDPYDFVVYREEEEGWQWDIAGGVTEYPEKFRIETLEIAFDVPKGSEVSRVSQPQPVYDTAHGTASYDVAAVTDGGLRLTLRLNPEDDAFSRIRDFVLTDGDGTPLEGDRFVPDVHMQVNTGGEDPALVYRYRWSLARLKDLPDTISLTCILEDGEQLVFPIQVR